MGNVRVTAALYTGMAPPLQAIRHTVGHILQMSYQPSTEEMELLPRPLSFSKKGLWTVPTSLSGSEALVVMRRSPFVCLTNQTTSTNHGLYGSIVKALTAQMWRPRLSCAQVYERIHMWNNECAHTERRKPMTVPVCSIVPRFSLLLKMPNFQALGFNQNFQRLHLWLVDENMNVFFNRH